jgi:DNA-binding MarR family transcriptional regulator
MQTASDSGTSRAGDFSLALLSRYSALGRAFFARTRAEISRTEAGVLDALETRAHRITELAAAEGITQPAATQLVNRLAERGWVERDSDPDDGRVVLVRITSAGEDELERLRTMFRDFLRDELAALDNRDVETLASAAAILDRLTTKLRDLP